MAQRVRDTNESAYAEFVQCIQGYVDPGTLHALSLTCRTAREVVLPKLFKHCKLPPERLSNTCNLPQPVSEYARAVTLTSLEGVHLLQQLSGPIVELQAATLGHEGIEHLCSVSFSALRSLSLGHAHMHNSDGLVGNEAQEGGGPIDLANVDVFSTIGRLHSEIHATLVDFLSNVPALRCFFGHDHQTIGGAPGAACLAACHNFTSTLNELSISGAEVDDIALTDIVTAQWPVLSKLSLRCNAFTSQGVQQLVHSTGLQSVQMLDLSSNALGCDGARFLTNSGGFALPMLQVLRLNHCSIGATGAYCLAHIAPAANEFQLSTQVYVELIGNNIGWSAAEHIQSHATRCIIVDVFQGPDQWSDDEDAA